MSEIINNSFFRHQKNKKANEQADESSSTAEIPGHPLYTFRQENREIKKLLNEQITVKLNNFQSNDSQENIYSLLEEFNLLWDIDKHYNRKENLLFPYLERHGLTSPTNVMWGVDDDIREVIKTVKKILSNYQGNKEEVIESVQEAIYEVDEMIFKEEHVLFPMAMSNLTEDEWIAIMDESAVIGYCLIEPEEEWKPVRVNTEEENGAEPNAQDDYVRFASGMLKVQEIAAVFNHLPVDITFIDKNDVVRYFSQSKDRVFMRTKAVIGRKVQHCHPPASVHLVERLLEEFKTGKKEHEDFWIRMGEKFVLIRYFVLRDSNGDYLGTVEVTQDINDIQKLSGEKRLIAD